MIETNRILQTDLLDILFDDRNKQYGAYELRKQYNRRMAIAVIVMLTLCLLVFLLFSFASRPKISIADLDIKDIELAKLKTEEPKPEQLPPPPKPKPIQVKTVQFNTPKITEDPIKPDEEIPDKEVLDETKIGKINQPGVDGPDVVAPPISGEGTGVIERPKKREDDEDGIVLHVQIESEYPGGFESWKRFLGKNIRYPELAIENEIEGTVLVQFIVDKAGLVSDVQAISGPNELRDEAVRVIKKSGQWTPAIQNGSQVKSYKRQPIVFRLEGN